MIYNFPKETQFIELKTLFFEKPQLNFTITDELQ